MRILFVDDEPRVLDGIENAMLFAPDGWEADFAESGERALELLADRRYDVLVTDMQMPGTTGADVLERARSLDPGMVRIVLSGEVNAELAERAMPLAAEFVTKPCAPDALLDVIERTHAAARSLGDGRCLERLMTADDLPADPALALTIQRCVDEGDGANEIAAVLESDLAIATQTIKMANSAFFGYSRPAENVLDAVVRLGATTITGLVLRAEAEQWAAPSEQPIVARLNRTSTEMAYHLDQVLGAEIRQARLAGLLHDVGRLLILARLPEQFRLIEAQAGTDPADGGTAVESELLGTTHPELGAYLLERWKVDPIVVEVARHHHQPEEAEGDARRLIDAMADLGR